VVSELCWFKDLEMSHEINSRCPETQSQSQEFLSFGAFRENVTQVSMASLEQVELSIQTLPQRASLAMSLR
jgi:hypothetical protein